MDPGPGRMDPEPDLLKILAAAVANANMRLQEMIISDPATEGMGTTLTALLWAGRQAALCHIGDSRAYLLRGGQLYQITHDHTLVQSLVDEGRITEDDVATHPQRSLLLRALDGRTLADPDLSLHDTMVGDRYLLCSDGLSGVVTEQTIQHVLNNVRDPEPATLQLIDLAIRGGGPDNITCIVADVVDTDVPGPAPTTKPVLAGAASNGTAAELRSAARHDSPAGRARRLTQTAPQQAMPDDSGGWDNHNGNGSRRGRRAKNRDDDDYDFGDNSGKRRWPIVSTALLVLLAVVFGGGYFAWRYTQSQYYVGEDSATGQVAVFRGVNQNIAGISLSSLMQRTGIKLSQVPRDQLASVQATIPFGNLSGAQSSVADIKASVTSCGSAYTRLATWQAAAKRYQAVVAQNRHSKKKIALPPNPGPQPAGPNQNCQQSTAFGIPGSALPPGTQTTTPPPTSRKSQ